MREATRNGRSRLSLKRMFQSAPPVREATSKTPAYHRWQDVSIRAPRAGGDRLQIDGYDVVIEFQSAPPVREATCTCATPIRNEPKFQSAPPVREATPCRTWDMLRPLSFQSAPPVREATPSRWRLGSAASGFNPRPPCGRRQQAAWDTEDVVEVSIRAPRAGGDAVNLYHCQTTRNPSACAKLLAKTGHSRGWLIVPAQFYHNVVALR